MTDYPVGTVAIVTDTVMGKGFEWRAHKVDKGWQGLDSNWGFVLDSEILTVRPLVVLDLAQIDEDGATSWPEVVGILRDCNSITAVCIADQIEAQTKPPHIPEPGLWGVVSVTNERNLTDYWTHGPGYWFNERGDMAEWGGLLDPVLVRPGIEDCPEDRS